MTTKKDFRNMKQTQFDQGQVLKGSFDELNSALRTSGTNAILKDSYTHFTQTINGNGYPTEVSYFQALDPAIDELVFVADVAKSLAGTYFILEEYLTKQTHAFYYVVGGTGTAPGVADVETAVIINDNDVASTVCFATKSVMDTIEEFIITSKNFLANSVTLEYFQFGETSAVNIGTSGFFVNRIKVGESKEVGHVELSYDGNNNPIYNGNTLQGFIYNAYTASFEVSATATSSTIITDSDGHELDINADGSVNSIPKKDYDNFLVTSRDSFNNITQIVYKLGVSTIRTVDLVYDVNGDLVSYTES